MIPAVESAIEYGITGQGIEPPAKSSRSGRARLVDSLDLRYQLNDYLVVQLQRDIDNMIGRINERGCI